VQLGFKKSAIHGRKLKLAAVASGARTGSSAQVVGNDREVGLGEVKRAEFAGGNPAQGGVFVGVRRIAGGEEPRDVRDKLNRDRRVSVRVRRERTKDFHGATKLFLQLAVQGGFGCLAGLDLAAGELPFAAEVFVRGALGHEHVAIAFDEGTDDSDGSRCGSGHVIWNSGNQERSRQSKWGMGSGAFP